MAGKKTNNGSNKKKGRPRPVRSIPRSMPSAGGAVAPSAYGVVQGGKAMFPLTSGVGKNMTVVNYELMPVGSAFTGTTGYVIGGSILNPGISSNWAWLGNIATNFSKFKFKFLRFVFVPQCPTSTPGSVFLYLSYDPRDQAPNTLYQVSAAESSVVGNAWYGGPISPDTAFSKQMSLKDNVYLDVDCSRFTQPWYYVRATDAATSNTIAFTGAPTGGIGTLALANAQTYEYTTRPGTIYYGNYGITNGVTAGYLYMSYAVEFFEPIAAAVNT